MQNLFKIGRSDFTVARVQTYIHSYGRTDVVRRPCHRASPTGAALKLTRLQHSIHSTPEVRNASARTDASPREEDHMLPFPNPLRHLVHLPTQLSRRVDELFLLLFIPDIVLPSGGSGVRLSPGMTGPHAPLSQSVSVSLSALPTSP